jgi:hypothetical protein
LVKYVRDIPDNVSVEVFGRGFSPSKISRIVVAMPAGSGKTTLCSKYGWRDIDDVEVLLSASQRKYFQDLRSRALAENTQELWDKHNAERNKMLLDIVNFLQPEVLLAHTAEPWSTGTHIEVKVDAVTHEDNIRDRHEEWRNISRLNWSTANYKIVDTNVGLEEYVVKWVTSQEVARDRITGTGYPEADHGYFAPDIKEHIQDNDVLWVNPPYIETINDWSVDLVSSVTNECYVSLPAWDDSDAVKRMDALADSKTTINIGFDVYEYHVNKRLHKRVLKVEDLNERMKYRDLEVSNPHSGQLKLLVADVQFMEYSSQPPVVVVAGAAPGSHFIVMAKMYPKTSFVLYDTSSFDPGLYDMTNVKIVTELYDGKYSKRHSLISDIRGDDTSDTAIRKDMDTQANWVKNKKVITSSLKFRFPFSGEVYHYLKGDLYFQAYARPTSSELRLFCRGYQGTVGYDSLILEEKCMYYNHVLRPNGHDALVTCAVSELLSDSSRAIFDNSFGNSGFSQYFNSDYSISPGHRTLHGMVTDNVWFGAALTRFVKSDIFDIKSKIDDFVVGLFSVSNVRNPPPSEALRLLSLTHDRILIMYGNGGAFGYWKPGNYGLTFSSVDKVSGEFRGRPVSDHCLRPNAVFPRSQRLMTITEAIASMRYHFTDSERYAVSSFEGNHPMMNAWLFITNFPKDFIDISFQTIFLSQTNFVRLPSLIIRHALSAPRFDLAIPRAYAGAIYSVMLKGKYEIYNGQPSIRVIRKGLPDIISDPSGHMINMAIMSSFGLIDYNHYLENVRTNVEAFFNKSGRSRRKVSTLARAGVLMEAQNDSFRLWHNYHDYMIAVIAIIHSCAFWRIPVPVLPLYKTVRVINNLLTLYPRFQDNIFNNFGTNKKRSRLLL